MWKGVRKRPRRARRNEEVDGLRDETFRSNPKGEIKNLVEKKFDN